MDLLAIIGCLILLTAILGPLYLAVAFRGRMRAGPSEPVCRACGYPTRGLRSSRCPECGGSLAGAGVVDGAARVTRWELVCLALVVLIPSVLLMMVLLTLQLVA